MTSGTVRNEDEIENIGDQQLELEEVEDEFSFVFLNPDGSPISADDAFVNGQIRSTFPLFDHRLLFSENIKNEDVKQKEAKVSCPSLRNLFLEEFRPPQSSATPDPEAAYYEWSPSPKKASPDICKKSYSTGFSKLWRFRDVIHRSNSDGKDNFVFIRNPSTGDRKVEKKATCTSTTTTGKSGNGGDQKAGKKSQETASSVHERHYSRNRSENETNKRKSYLPYRKNLMGFFFFPSSTSMAV